MLTVKELRNSLSQEKKLVLGVIHRCEDDCSALCDGKSFTNISYRSEAIVQINDFHTEFGRRQHDNVLQSKWNVKLTKKKMAGGGEAITLWMASSSQRAIESPATKSNSSSPFARDSECFFKSPKICLKFWTCKI